jgi:hypothetical protein
VTVLKGLPSQPSELVARANAVDLGVAEHELENSVSGAVAHGLLSMLSRYRH